jgi:hypothetical protein
MIPKIKKFYTVLHKCFKITIAAVLPVLLFSYLGHFKIGFTIALGAFFTYPSDIRVILSIKWTEFLLQYLSFLVSIY